MFTTVVRSFVRNGPIDHPYNRYRGSEKFITKYTQSLRRAVGWNELPVHIDFGTDLAPNWLHTTKGKAINIASVVLWLDGKTIKTRFERVANTGGTPLNNLKNNNRLRFNELSYRVDWLNNAIAVPNMGVEGTRKSLISRFNFDEDMSISRFIGVLSDECGLYTNLNRCYNLNRLRHSANSSFLNRVYNDTRNGDILCGGAA